MALAAIVESEKVGAAFTVATVLAIAASIHARTANGESRTDPNHSYLSACIGCTREARYAGM